MASDWDLSPKDMIAGIQDMKDRIHRQMIEPSNHWTVPVWVFEEQSGLKFIPENYEAIEKKFPGRKMTRLGGMIHVEIVE